MASQIPMNAARPPHFVLIPLFTQGHMIPMVDIARLIADRGAHVTFITTPVNASRIKPIINRVKAAGLPIQFVELEFPCREGGLPDGCENCDLVPSFDLMKPFFEAMRLLREPLLLYLQELNPGPTCMITDCIQYWTTDIARSLNIPRLIFHGPSAFYILCKENIERSKVYESVDDEYVPVVVPNLPQKIEINQAQAPVWFHPPGWEKMREGLLEAEAAADGILINTFHELEPEYVELYEKVMEKKVWTIGPLSLYNKDAEDRVTRGDKASMDEHHIVSWLDTMDPRSVIFVSFGSMVRTRPSQLIEIGSGLEASGQPFIWVIKEAEKSAEVEKWMSEGFVERTRDRSLVITGWAPQLVIMSHPSIGGFMTHCGWNSMLEAVSAGVPMITWPHFADQFLNEKFAVDVIRIGVSIGIKVPYFNIADDQVAVKRDDVMTAVNNLMDGGTEGEERRKRARELAGMAQKAMEGGSSYENLTHMIQFFSEGAN